MFFFTRKTIFDNPVRFTAMAAAAGIFAALAVSALQNDHVEASRSFVVRNERHAAENVYDYEGYYTMQTANEAAKTLVSWLASPGGARAVYADAGVALDAKRLRDASRVFSISRSETPFFEVRYRARTLSDAEAISASLASLLHVEVGAFQGASSLSLGETLLVAYPRPVPFARNILYGAILGAALGAFAVLFKRALAEGK